MDAVDEYVVVVTARGVVTIVVVGIVVGRGPSDRNLRFFLWSES
jgi:hypothetical protein